MKDFFSKYIKVPLWFATLALIACLSFMLGSELTYLSVRNENFYKEAILREKSEIRREIFSTEYPDSKYEDTLMVSHNPK